MVKFCVRAMALAVLLQVATTPGQAQIVTDGSVGPALAIGGPDHAITADLGRRAGANLFHSFSQFNIATGARATFSGPDDVRAVISRVTGAAASLIDGTLRSTIPEADVFLINPHGLIFGPNAALDIDGSFHAASADQIAFADGGIYSAVDLDGSTFSVAAPAAFGFLGTNSGAINLLGSALSLPADATLTLASRDIALFFATLDVSNGTIGLLGVGPSGSTPLAGAAQTGAAGDFSGSLSLTGGLIRVSGTGGETVTIKSGQVQLSNMVILADSLGAGTADDKGGGVRIDGRESVTIDNGSAVLSATFSAATSGDIVVDTKDFLIAGGSILDTLTLADGNGGDITIRATTRARIDQASLTSNAEFGSTGTVGSITLVSPLLEMPGGRISTNARGFGQGGVVRLDVGSLAGSLDGTIAAGTFGAGDAGEVVVSAGGGALAAAGSISIADDFTITGTAFPFSSGAAGRLTLAAASLDMSGGLISSSTFGPGAGGRVDIDVGSLSMRNLAKIDSSTFGPGNAGAITVKAADSISIADSAVITTTTLSFSGAAAGAVSVTAPRLAMTGGFISATSFFTGAGGSVAVDVDELTLSGPSEISTDTFGAGAAGTITVTAARSVTLAGDTTTKITSRTATGSTGDAGAINLNAPALDLIGGLIGTESAGTGRGGAVTIAVDAARIAQAGTITASASDSEAGDIRIEASGTLDLADDGSISSSMLEGAGAGGRVTLLVGDLRLADNSQIAAITTGAGNGGDIVVQAVDTVTVSDNALITADQRARADGSSTTANAGSVSIKARLLVVDKNGAITATTVDGGGGDITVDAVTVQVFDAGRIGSSSQGSGFAGSLLIKASDKLLIHGGEITAEALQGNGGNITIEVGELVELRGGQITTTVLNSVGDGGNIDVDPTFLVLVDSRIIANAFAGAGGNIQLTADILLIDDASIISASSALGIAGTVVIEAPDTDVTTALAVLNGEFLNAAAQLAQQCAARGGQTAATLTAAGRGALPANPNSVQVADYFVTASGTIGAIGNGTAVAAARTPAIITLRCAA